MTINEKEVVTNAIKLIRREKREPEKHAKSHDHNQNVTIDYATRVHKSSYLWTIASEKKQPPDKLIGILILSLSFTTEKHSIATQTKNNKKKSVKDKHL